MNDFWAWDYLLAYQEEDSLSREISLPNFTGGGTAAVTVNLVGTASESTAGADPFLVSVFLNDVNIGTEEWPAEGDRQFRTEVPADLLREEGNEVKIISGLNSGVLFSFIYLDSITVEYQSRY